ncbi:hypothetical protein AVEN_137945-1 [Araneus ventricosus]|uniref:Uncharacterized protein n=1 Tax=Araneus ventricosus TaxID=182803 RepID=A0A4Y2GXJ5_ARAVE|nr:hypothetical protein AVEN_137945-1 [Araneus ventricosus]
MRTTPGPASRSQNVHAAPAESGLALNVPRRNMPQTRKLPADLRWNQISNLESSGDEAESLPPGHHGRKILRNLTLTKFYCYFFRHNDKGLNGDKLSKCKILIFRYYNALGS